MDVNGLVSRYDGGDWMMVDHPNTIIHFIFLWAASRPPLREPYQAMTRLHHHIWGFLQGVYGNLSICNPIMKQSIEREDDSKIKSYQVIQQLLAYA